MRRGNKYLLKLKYPEIKNIAGRLRKEPTESERILWGHLRKKQLGGYRFLRQHPLYYEHDSNDHFFFVPDFYCPEKKVIIELDGGVHLGQKERDKNRDEILENRGFRILRINNEDLSDINLLKERILNFITKECK
jgi:very-short-patch-repair endonuclease